jgi:site-specific recombinase XerD
VDGTWRYVGQRIKTGVPYVSELLPPAVEVLQKYGGTVPQINNADYNHRLKEIQRLTGIATRLHSHLARHTFATWMLANGAKIENVARMLGHENIVTTQRYCKVLAQSVHEDYGKVRGKL